MLPSSILIEILIHGIFHENSTFAYFDDPQYQTKSSGITKYRTMDINYIFLKTEFFNLVTKISRI